jgi:hypothetical protein
MAHIAHIPFDRRACRALLADRDNRLLATRRNGCPKARTSNIAIENAFAMAVRGG